VRDAAVSDVFKTRIDDNTNEAVARGLFGVPTIDTGTKLYWGNDRLELLDIHLSRT
jgi:2-hydroxychromene-2-carboxylate isomerase